MFHDTVLRLGIFVLVFALLAFAETVRPQKARLFSRKQRWLAHFGMFGLATLLVRMAAMLFPLIGATAAAVFAAQSGWGLLQWMTLLLWLEIIMAVVLLDLAIWVQHVATHRVPILWRIHRVHHADRDLDASSALRFHPLEILLSAAYKFSLILLLGPAVMAVIIFEVLLNASALFNHANWAIPPQVDRWLRSIVVTPDMHRIHHSTIISEQCRNFGLCLSVWDRIFRTYSADPEHGQSGMTIGLSEWQKDDRSARLGWMLGFPFQR